MILGRWLQPLAGIHRLFMRFGVLALDYDGTIALDGVLDPDVRRAIGEARSGGIVVLIVTGRKVSDLKSLVGDIGFVDAVVAENGAVIALPDGQAQLLAAPPPPSFVRELGKEGIPFSVGQCVVEADATWAHEILTLIQRLELPLVLLFNRGRLMVLPQAVSKSVGLRREKPTNIFYFGTQKITTKVYMMAPAERKGIELDVVDYMWDGTLQGPPSRPLPRVMLERQGEHLVATGMKV